MSSKASSDPVDLEKGVTGLRKEEDEEELSAVDPRKSMCIKLLLVSFCPAAFPSFHLI
jgi:hypothetical protein